MSEWRSAGVLKAREVVQRGGVAEKSAGGLFREKLVLQERKFGGWEVPKKAGAIEGPKTRSVTQNCADGRMVDQKRNYPGGRVVELESRV